MLLPVHRSTAVAGLVGLVLIVACIVGAGGARATAARPEKAATTARRQAKAAAASGPAGHQAQAKARSAPAARPAAARAQRALTTAIGPISRDDDGQVAVAVDDLTTGADAAYGGAQEFVTASIVKVDILSTLLYQAQQSGQPLLPEEQALATTMIENSNDDAASDLYDEADGASGIDAANHVFGLAQTAVGTDGFWGLTTTTADDQLRLLRLVFTRPSVLTAQSQDYVQNLMSQVEPDQQWGVPAAADAGTQFMVKNGWLPSGTTGLWEINSIGEVVHDRQRMLIAVLSAGNATEDSGISLVQTVAETAASAVASAVASAKG
jgi:hypothetical protein